MSPQALSDRERFPELFVEDKHIDRRKCKREVPMKVLVFGMMRTGTASMRVALKKLGFDDTYHMMSVMENTMDSQMWIEAYEAKYFGKGKPFEREDWDQLLGHCQAVCDLPPAPFVPELLAAYPDAKVVLTQRSPESWHKSVMDTIMRGADPSSPMARIMRVLDLAPRFNPRLMQVMFDGIFGGRERFVTHGQEVYVAMHDEIRRLVPKEKLLDYRMGEGWERLCEFLEVPVPEGEFPRVNETSEFGERMAVMKRQALRRVLRRVGWWVGVVAVPAVGAAWYLYGGRA